MVIDEQALHQAEGRSAVAPKDMMVLLVGAQFTHEWAKSPIQGRFRALTGTRKWNNKTNPKGKKRKERSDCKNGRKEENKS
jgi:hypothetical protein